MRPISFIRKFLALEAAGGLLLLCIACLALAIANSPWQASYQQLLTISPAENTHFNLLTVVNDGLMTLFFLLVGLEIKREMLQGELAAWSQRLLPGIAALGGMLAPALIYLMWHHNNLLLVKGWAVPTATDIAFALGILSLLGPRVPIALKVFLTALAILDDLGAVVIITLFYAQPLNSFYLISTLGCYVILIMLNLFKISRLLPYLLLGLPLWYCMLQSGLHPTLAGVLLAFVIPLTGVKSPIKKLEQKLHPWVAYLILPLFAFANAGVFFNQLTWKILWNPLSLAIAISLFIGKQLGIFSSIWLVVKLGWAKLPARTTWLSLYGMSLLCGIGFTMSLFIGTLAFSENSKELINFMKIGVLSGSLLSGIVGYCVLRFSFRNKLLPG